MVCYPYLPMNQKIPNSTTTTITTRFEVIINNNGSIEKFMKLNILQYKLKYRIHVTSETYYISV